MMRIKSIKSFSARMFLSVFLFVVIPMYILNLVSVKKMENTLQERLSEQVIENISKNEGFVYEQLQDLAYYSTLFVNDKELRERISNSNTQLYENSKYFDQIVERAGILSLETRFPSLNVLLLDKYDRIYSNLPHQQNVQEINETLLNKSKIEHGHVVWDMFGRKELSGEGKESISLARAVLSNGTDGVQIGTIIISISKEDFEKTLMEYSSPGNFVYMCMRDGTVLLNNDRKKEISSSEFSKVYSKIDSSYNGRTQVKISDKNFLVSYYTMRKPWEFNGRAIKVINFTDYDVVRNDIMALTLKIDVTAGILCIMVILILVVLSNWLVKPIKLLTQKMESFDVNTPIVGLDIKRKDEIGKLNESFVRMGNNIHRLFDQLNREHKIREQYHYESLRAQLNPHFIFNTLLNVKSMAKIRGADNIVKCIDAFGNLLSYSMLEEKTLVSLQEEIKNVESYIYVHNCRYPDYAKLRVDVSEDLLDAKMMKFILQPIVENAVVHGYDNKCEELCITIRAWRQEHFLYIHVIDDGVGISKDAADAFESGKKNLDRDKMTKIGLSTVDSCIRMAFGESYGLSLKAGENRGTIVKFILPEISDKEGEAYENGFDCG